LDTIGLAGFSHNFESLNGKQTPLAAALDSFGDAKQDVPTMLMLLLAPLFPVLTDKFPSDRLRVLKSISPIIGSLAGELIDSARTVKELAPDGSTDKSIIGSLGKSMAALNYSVFACLLARFLSVCFLSVVKSENANSPSIRLTSDEIKAEVCPSNYSGHNTHADSSLSVGGRLVFPPYTFT
jgi:hypothetical protein